MGPYKVVDGAVVGPEFFAKATGLTNEFLAYSMNTAYAAGLARAAKVVEAVKKSIKHYLEDSDGNISPCECALCRALAAYEGGAK